MHACTVLPYEAIHRMLSRKLREREKDINASSFVQGEDMDWITSIMVPTYHYSLEGRIDVWGMDKVGSHGSKFNGHRSARQ